MAGATVVAGAIAVLDVAGGGYRGLGWGPGGFAAGAAIGAVLATPYYYYPVPAYPAYYYYSYPAPAYYYYGVGSGGCCY